MYIYNIFVCVYVCVCVCVCVFILRTTVRVDGLEVSTSRIGFLRIMIISYVMILFQVVTNR